MLKKIKAVLDTNILISAVILEGSKSQTLLNYGLDEKYIIVITGELIEEFKEVVNREKIKKRYKVSPEKVEKLLNDLMRVSNFFVGRYRIDKFRDSKDNPLLACAMEGRADYIITGDKELLNLKNVMGIEIITINDFISRLKKRTTE